MLGAGHGLVNVLNRVVGLQPVATLKDTYEVIVTREEVEPVQHVPRWDPALTTLIRSPRISAASCSPVCILSRDPSTLEVHSGFSPHLLRDWSWSRRGL